jgi:hypothetical protein
VRLESEPENTRLMRVKYEEKQAEILFIKEQKEVEEKLEEFNRRNLEHLEDTKLNYNKIKQHDNKIIANNQMAK